MLTTLSIVSFDQGKIWREAPVPAEPAEMTDAAPAPAPVAARPWLPRLRLPGLPAILRPVRG